VRTTVLAVVLVVFAGLELAAQAPGPVATFKSSVDLVPITAVVRDSHGRMITTLKAADFEVLDKGEARRILDFQVDQTSPITMAILVDTSGSMRLSSKLPFAREVVKYLTADLQEGRDEVSLFTFDSALHEQQPFTVHPASLDAALTKAQPFGITSLYDAIAETARRLGDRPSPRRAIVVLTDGVDTGSLLSPAEVSALASSIDVPVYVVATVMPLDRAAYIEHDANHTVPASTDLRDLARWTGGDFLWVTAEPDAGLRVHQILSELRHQYLIAIESATQREWRPLEIHVRGKHLNVRSRSGYFSHVN